LKFWALGVGLCLALASSVCSQSSSLLSSSYPTPEALAAAVLDAVARNDTAALDALALNEQEFREHVWPELPASRPERNLPFSYVWGDLHQKSRESMRRTLAQYGGRRFRLAAVRFAGETTQYPSYTVRRDTVIQVVPDTGAPTDLRLFGSSIEKDGGWRVFSYVVDE
jgi:hypothetical protein